MAAPASSSSCNSNPQFHTCSICTIDVVPDAVAAEEQSIETRCGHVFHQFCLNRWMASPLAQGKCPNCRQIAFPQLAPIDLPQNLAELPRFEPEVENIRIPENVALRVADFLGHAQPFHLHIPMAGGMGPPPKPFKDYLLEDFSGVVKDNSGLVDHQGLREKIANEFLSRKWDKPPLDSKKIQFPQSYRFDRIQPIAFNIDRILEGEREQRAIMLQRIIAASFEPQPVQAQPQSLWARILSYLPWFNRQ